MSTFHLLPIGAHIRRGADTIPVAFVGIGHDSRGARFYSWSGEVAIEPGDLLVRGEHIEPLSPRASKQQADQQFLDSGPRRIRGVEGVY